MFRTLALAFVLVGAAIAQTTLQVSRFLEQAEHGDAGAAFWLGVAYERGNAVNQDSAEALRWFLQSAKHGSADAQNALGQIYEEGNGVQQDYVRAASWYQAACENRPNYGGAGQGCNNVGLLYLDGLGVPRNYVEAYKYFKLAGTVDNVMEARSNMTSSEVALAEQQLQQWHRGHPER